jgi:hypothetical protein
MNCPFYGRALFVPGLVTQRQTPPFILFDQHGNQCALVATSHAPCQMEVNGEVPDWKTCGLVREMRMENDDG